MGGHRLRILLRTVVALSGSQRAESPCLVPQSNIDDQTVHDTRGFEKNLEVLWCTLLQLTLD